MSFLVGIILLAIILFLEMKQNIVKFVAMIQIIAFVMNVLFVENLEILNVMVMLMKKFIKKFYIYEKRHLHLQHQLD